MRACSERASQGVTVRTLNTENQQHNVPLGTTMYIVTLITPFLSFSACMTGKLRSCTRRKWHPYHTPCHKHNLPPIQPDVRQLSLNSALRACRDLSTVYGRVLMQCSLVRYICVITRGGSFCHCRCIASSQLGAKSLHYYHRNFCIIVTSA